MAKKPDSEKPKDKAAVEPQATPVPAPSPKTERPGTEPATEEAERHFADAVESVGSSATEAVDASAEILKKRPSQRNTRKPDELVARRDEVRKWWQGQTDTPPDGLIGFALSGGGIRSATFSLGLIQALAKSKRDALSRIDFLSTVSGGGYTGCFLRSLFMPDNGRGITPQAMQSGGSAPAGLSMAEITEQHDFARAILASGTKARNFKWKRTDGTEVTRRNPLWWLREHSRFLAPNGATDYGYALAYIARNWIAMVYIFFVASLAIFTILGLLEAAFRTMTSADLGASPVFFGVVPPVALSAIFCVAYWITQAMSPNEPDLRRQWKNLLTASTGTLVGCLFIVGAATWANGAPPAFQRVRPSSPVNDWISLAIVSGLALVLTAMAITIILAIIIARRDGATLTIDLRRKLTSWLANSNQWFIIIACAALVDTLGGWLADWAPTVNWELRAISTAWVLPVLAYLIKKLPDWFGKTGSTSPLKLVSRFISGFSLATGLILYGIVAVAAATLIHAIVWDGASWASAPNWIPSLLITLIVACLALLAGRASGFINMSSLHFFYASQLTRAYLGATNNRRLEAAAIPGPLGNITETDAHDYIQPELYCSAGLPAPLHIINATINETVDPESQLVARDRKGNLLSLEPGGVRVGKDAVTWSNLGKSEFAEQLSLGQWCAISGAAVSAGMGRLTNLGYALALTFANVRLGYWWWAPGVCTGATVGVDPFTRRFAKTFGTFVYLANEITARYSRLYTRKYLTDGGHFENTGAYRLLEREVPLIIVSDNGADPTYRFADLENLTRKVRIDLGAELVPLGGSELRSFLNGYGVSDTAIFVDPDGDGDWRDQFVSGDPRRFVLVLRATFDAASTHLIWIKPRALKNLPADILVYSSTNPPFPQQATGDQFFDESQWESYRALGEISMSRLLASCPALLA